MLAFKPLFTALLAGALLTGAVSPASAATLKLGLYDCVDYDFATGMLINQGSLKLKGKGKYKHGFHRDGTKLMDETSGKYKIKGSKIVFKTGTLKETPGRIHPPDKSNTDPWFNFMVDGEETGASCYLVRNPT